MYDNLFVRSAMCIQSCGLDLGVFEAELVKPNLLSRTCSAGMLGTSEIDYPVQDCWPQNAPCLLPDETKDQT